jgi:hypothetical protein
VIYRIYRITASAHYLAYRLAYYLVHYLIHYLAYYLAVASFLLITQPATAVTPAAVTPAAIITLIRA